MSAVNTIRDQREAKNISQVALATAAGVSEGVLIRIEQGSAKTTDDEIAHVTKVLKGMPEGTRKIAGRPFADAKKNEAVKAAREAGLSVAETIAKMTPAPVKAPAKAAPAKAATKAPAKAPAKKAPAKAPAKK